MILAGSCWESGLPMCVHLLYLFRLRQEASRVAWLRRGTDCFADPGDGPGADGGVMSFVAAARIITKAGEIASHATSPGLNNTIADSNAISYPKYVFVHL